MSGQKTGDRETRTCRLSQDAARGTVEHSRAAAGRIAFLVSPCSCQRSAAQGYRQTSRIGVEIPWRPEWTEDSAHSGSSGGFRDAEYRLEKRGQIESKSVSSELRNDFFGCCT